MDFDQSGQDFSKASVLLYPPDHIAYLNKEPLLVNKVANNATGTTSTTELSSSSLLLFTPDSYELQEILAGYRSQPELLQLIVESKIQHDRRRSEEAQLKAKELDIILLQHQQRPATMNLPDQPQIALFTRNRPHDSLFSSHVNSDLYEILFLQHMTSKPSTLKLPKSRKRREMQAITKTVETNDHAYVDGHCWRNNGKTIQKKTGNKSVYFKCANSIKGCPVNKTSTYNQMTGEYIIKYRGNHLPECAHVERIVER